MGMQDPKLFFAEALRRYQQQRGVFSESTPSGAVPTTPDLTDRQREVLACLVRGESTKQIARTLNLAQGTVKVHLAAIFQKLGVTSRTAAAVAGARILDGQEH